jgi:hypothetical protein
MATYDTERDK